MKKFIFALTFLGVTTVGQAAVIACNPVNQNTITVGVITTPIVVACGNVDATFGNVITSLSVSLVGSFNDAVSGTLHHINFVGTASFGGASVSATTNIADFAGTSSLVDGVPVVVANLSSLGSVDVSVVTTLMPGSIVPNNASFTAFLVTTEAPIDGPPVPEPGSLALLGSGLVGLGLVARRRTAKK